MDNKYGVKNVIYELNMLDKLPDVYPMIWEDKLRENRVAIINAFELIMTLENINKKDSISNVLHYLRTTLKEDYGPGQEILDGLKNTTFDFDDGYPDNKISKSSKL